MAIFAASCSDSSLAMISFFVFSTSLSTFADSASSSFTFCLASAWAWLGFWGSYLFYRAFTIAFPEGRARSYARFMFLLPSFLFWPSSIGKEAWMICCIGMATYGVALILKHNQLGYPVAAFGLTGVLIAKLSSPAAGGFGYSLWVGIPVALAVALVDRTISYVSIVMTGGTLFAVRQVRLARRHVT